jgi:hypothetical protein
VRQVCFYLGFACAGTDPDLHRVRRHPLFKDCNPLKLFKDGQGNAL